MSMRIGGFCALVVVLVGAAPARADDNGFAELVVGLANPIGDDDYDNFVDTSFKLGLRTGVFQGRPLSGGVHLGFELGADWALADNALADQPAFDATFHRLRFLGGGRVQVTVAQKLSLFCRAAAGIDYVIGEITGSLGALSFTWEENDLGLALELGAGAVVEAGGYLFGMQLALPIGWHDDTGGDIQYDYTSYEVDLLITAGTRF